MSLCMTSVQACVCTWWPKCNSNGTAPNAPCDKHLSTATRKSLILRKRNNLIDSASGGCTEGDAISLRVCSSPDPFLHPTK